MLQLENATIHMLENQGGIVAPLRTREEETTLLIQENKDGKEQKVVLPRLSALVVVGNLHSCRASGQFLAENYYTKPLEASSLPEDADRDATEER